MISTNVNVVLIDHDDSFTFNVVEMLRNIKGTIITVINYNDLILQELNKFDKIILSPGPSLPQDYPKTIKLIETYYTTKPILGICLGHQAICSFFGAELYNFKEVIHGVNKTITIKDNTNLFKNVSLKTEVGLYHSWAVSEVGFPNEILNITSKSVDEVVMSVKHREFSVYGIQFHPESFLTIEGKIMLNNFIKL